jgi:hypothetical protein
VDLFVHEVRTFDLHLPDCGKVDQSEAFFICTLMQVALAYRWLMCGFPADFYLRVSHHQLNKLKCCAKFIFHQKTALENVLEFVPNGKRNNKKN